MSRIAIACAKKGHDTHLFTVDNERGRNGIPKLIDGTDVKLHLSKGPEMDALMQDVGDDMMDPKDKFVEEWKEDCLKQLREVKPDIIVADIYGVPGWHYSQETGCPFVINNPAGPFDMYQEVGFDLTPNMSKATNICGRMVIS